MKVSVIIPMYNAASTIGRCLQSILDLETADMEVLVIDDGSTDSGRGLCEDRFQKDSRGRLIVQKNAGPSAARNRGISLAKGDYLMFLDADDYVNTENLRKMLERLDREENIDILIGKASHFREGGEILEESCILEESSILDVNGEKAYGMISRDTGLFLWAPWRGIYRKELFEEPDIRFPEHMALGEDLVTIPSLYQRARAVRVWNEPFYFYQIGQEKSLSKKKNLKQLKSCLNAIETWHRRFREEQHDPVFKEILKSQMADIYCGLLSYPSYMERSEVKEALRLMKEDQWILEGLEKSKQEFQVQIRRIGLKNYCRLKRMKTLLRRGDGLS